MGHWNYRIMKRENNEGQFEFGIYEVFYDDNGKVIASTENSLTPVCDSEEDLRIELNIMMKAFDKETLTYNNGA